MNPQTYDDLKAEITMRLGNRQDLASRIDQWAIDAFTELSQAPLANFRELDASVDLGAKQNVAIIDTPADFWFVLSLRTQWRRLDQVHWQIFDQTYRTTGIPTRFCR